MDDLIKIKEIDGKLITTSLNVGHVFTKEHKNVLRTIDGLKMSNEFRSLNFELTDYIDKNGDKQRKYLMTRDGWTILVMGFKDENAMRFKEMYIAKFNEMEKHLRLNDPSQMTMLDWIELARSQEIEKLSLIESNQLLENKITEDKPLVEFAKNIESSPESIEVGDLANVLCKKGFEIGRNRLFKAMKGPLKMLITAQKPYQYALDNLWLEVEEFPFIDNSEEKKERIAKKVMVTGKGQVYVEKKLREIQG